MPQQECLARVASVSVGGADGGGVCTDAAHDRVAPCTQELARGGVGGPCAAGKRTRELTRGRGGGARHCCCDIGSWQRQKQQAANAARCLRRLAGPPLSLTPVIRSPSRPFHRMSLSHPTCIAHPADPIHHISLTPFLSHLPFTPRPSHLPLYSCSFSPAAPHPTSAFLALGASGLGCSAPSLVRRCR